LPRLLTLIALATFGLCGCGPAAPVKYTVTGSVTFEGKPVTEGSITFEDTNTGIADTFPIDSQGSYSATIESGKFGVSVQPPMIHRPDMANTMGGDEFKKVENIPARYWSAFESGLTVDVSQDTTYDILMKRGG